MNNVNTVQICHAAGDLRAPIREFVSRNQSLAVNRDADIRLASLEH
jgi:hypothetical protein